MIEQNIDVMVSQDALRTPRVNQGADNINNCWTVWPTVGQITNEDEPSSVWVTASLVITEMPQQRAKCIDFTVDIAHYVKWAVEQGLD
jgi:hypothetical protein